MLVVQHVRPVVEQRGDLVGRLEALAETALDHLHEGPLHVGAIEGVGQRGRRAGLGLHRRICRDAVAELERAGDRGTDARQVEAARDAELATKVATEMGVPTEVEQGVALLDRERDAGRASVVIDRLGLDERVVLVQHETDERVGDADRRRAVGSGRARVIANVLEEVGDLECECLGHWPGSSGGCAVESCLWPLSARVRRTSRVDLRTRGDRGSTT